MRAATRHGEIDYEAIGEGSPFLNIHGWGCDRGLMKGSVEPVFARAGAPKMRRIYLDLPGMGKSPAPATIEGSDDMLDAIVDFIGVALPAGPFLLAGESYGGYLARGLLRRMPGRVAGLFLLCPSFKPWKLGADGKPDRGDVPARRVIERDGAFMAGLAEGARRSFEELGVRLVPDAWRRYSRDVLPGLLAADRDFLDHRLSRRVPLSTDPDEGRGPFEGPTLIVAGRQDSAAGYRGIWSLIEDYPRASFAVLDGAGHNAQTERPGVIEPLIRDWLDRVLAAPVA